MNVRALRGTDTSLFLAGYLDTFAWRWTAIAWSASTAMQLCIGQTSCQLFHLVSDGDLMGERIGNSYVVLLLN